MWVYMAMDMHFELIFQPLFLIVHTFISVDCNVFVHILNTYD
jgi:hypothetical protein